MRIAAVLACLLPLASAVGKAQTPTGADQNEPAATTKPNEETRAEARRYVEQAGYDKNVIDGLIALRTQYVQSYTGLTHLTPDAAATFFDSYILPAARVNVGQMVEAYVDAFAGAFSVEELRELEAFFATPVGLKFRAQQGKLLSDLSVAQYGWQKKVMGIAWAKYRADNPAMADKPLTTP